MSNSSGDSNATLLGARALDDEPMISGIFVFMGFAAVVFVCVIVSHVAISNAQRETEWQQRAALAEEELMETTDCTIPSDEDGGSGGGDGGDGLSEKARGKRPAFASGDNGAMDHGTLFLGPSVYVHQ